MPFVAIDEISGTSVALPHTVTPATTVGDVLNVCVRPHVYPGSLALLDARGDVVPATMLWSQCTWPNDGVITLRRLTSSDAAWEKIKVTIDEIERAVLSRFASRRGFRDLEFGWPDCEAPRIGANSRPGFVLVVEDRDAFPDVPFLFRTARGAIDVRIRTA